MIIFLLSCKKETLSVSDSNIRELEKIETMYTEGVEKTERFLLQDEIKIETSASDEYMSEILRLSRRTDFEKNKSSKSSDRVGVIIDYNGSCGSYDLLAVTMDCEDSGNENSHSGWIGGNVVNANVVLKFCLVPKSAFQSSKYYKYAVLSLDYGWVDMIERYFDNEDGASINNVKLNGVILTADEIYEELGGGIVQNNNTQLCFYVYDQDPQNGAESFPDLSIGDYGVFGYFGTGPKGYIYTDDEDTRNANAEWYEWHFIPKVGNESYFLYVQDLVKPTGTAGRNTTLYMTEVDK
jgi:hypothetical protein